MRSAAGVISDETRSGTHRRRTSSVYNDSRTEPGNQSREAIKKMNVDDVRLNNNGPRILLLRNSIKLSTHLDIIVVAHVATALIYFNLIYHLSFHSA